MSLSTRLSAFNYSLGVLAADLGRNFLVIAGKVLHTYIFHVARLHFLKSGEALSPEVDSYVPPIFFGHVT